jgi:chromate transporter
MVPFLDALRYWFVLGLISFGGPAGQISVLHRELVEKRRWIGESDFLNALNLCLLLPGPEAHQMVIYLGWRLHGVWGAIAAGVLFVLPATGLLFALSWIFIQSGNSSWLLALFEGQMPAVIAIVVSSVLRIGRSALKTFGLGWVALISFGSVLLFKVSFVWIVMGAGLLGWTAQHALPNQFPCGGKDPRKSEEDLNAVRWRPSASPSIGRALRVSVICLGLWWAPVLGVVYWRGWESTLAQLGLFFSKAALVTFGGAYAVLPYVAQQAVEHYGWLSHAQMMSGLGLAETTPGPLIIVLQFVGFVAGWQHPEGLSPALAAVLGALVTNWVTFLPSFLFVLLGAPHVDSLRECPKLGSALMAIRAAVVGVMVNLAIQFGLHSLVGPRGGLNPFSVGVAVFAFVALERFKLGIPLVLGGSALLGFAWRAVL